MYIKWTMELLLKTALEILLLISTTELPTLSKGSPIRPNEPTLDKNIVRKRIIGGSNTMEGEFPWQVSIEKIQFGNSISEKICGGVIFNEWTVLTAAHCLNSGGEQLPSNLFHTIAGIINIQNPDGTEQRIVASGLKVHDYFDLETIQNDIAIIYLRQPLIFNNNVKPIRLATRDTAPIGTCTAIGWGINNTDPEEYPELLQKVDLDIVDRKECENLWGKGTVTEGMICAHRPSEGTCHGDSGSGLICRNSDGHHYLAGIVSWGQSDPHCAHNLELPSVFTSIGHYEEWIKSELKHTQPEVD